MLKCGIYDQEGNPWAVSPGMAGTPAQVKRLAANYKDSSVFYQQGPEFEDSKFTFLLNMDDGSDTPVMVFKRKDVEGEEEKHFLVAMNTYKACLVGIAKGGDAHKSRAIELIKHVHDSMKAYQY